MPYIFSIQPCGTNYPKYSPLMPGDKGVTPRVIERSVSINGGAGIFDPKLGYAPAIVETFVTDEELAFLKTLDHFNDHVDKNFLTIMKDNKTPHEEVANDMQKENKSLPMDAKKLKLTKKGSGESVTYVMPSVEEITELGEKK